MIPPMTTPKPKLSLPREKIKVLLLEGIHSQAVAAFQGAGYTQIETHPKSLLGDALTTALADAHVVGVRSRTQLTADVLRAAPKLFAVGCFCIGTNQVDLPVAQELGIPVFNAPFSNTRSVAELVVAEAVLLLRGIPARNARAHRGEWSKSATGAHEARGRTLGIVGYGHIGTQVGVLAEAFGMRVIYHDIETKLALGNAAAAAGLDDLLARSDIVTLHVPDTPLTRGMIGEAELSRMKAGSLLINASRGTVVDVEALAAVLDSGHLAGAAVDVFPVEPKSNTDPFESALRGIDSALLTPHIGGSTEEAQQNIGVEVAEKLVRYSDNGSTLSSVNFPEVNLPAHEGKHRVLHIHENRPGTLRRINDVISSFEVNIAAEFLQTTEQIGYVVIDLDGGGRTDTRAIKKALDSIEGTIRCRALY